MKLRTKAILIIGSTVVLIAITVYCILNIYLTNSLKSQEQGIVRKNLTRAESLLNDTANNINLVNNDWAHWDETFNFVQTINPEYIDSNLNDESISNLNVNVFAIFDENKNIKYIKCFNTITQKSEEPSSTLINYLNTNKTILCKNKDLRGNISGIVSIDKKPLMISSMPITNSNFEEPIGGTLFIGRYIDDTIINKIEDLLDFKVKINNIDDYSNYEKYVDTYGEGVKVKDKNIISGYKVVKGIENEPLFIIELDQNRDIYAQSTRSLIFSTYLFLIFLSILLLLCVYLFQVHVIKPIEYISQRVGLIKDNNFNSKIIMNRRDELGQLSEEINNMVSKIQCDRSLLIENEQQIKNDTEELKNLSQYDKLTGLYNRAYFEYILNKIEKQDGMPFSIIIFDINGLKIINDNMGHEAGDALLVKTADALNSICGSESIVARWGGDTFAVLLINVYEKEAEIVCEKIKSECKNNFSINLAYGKATKRESSQNTLFLLKEAEERMYRNKLFDNTSSKNSLITTLGYILAEKSHETEEHATRIYNYCIKIGKNINLNIEEMDDLYLLAKLHDIGKIAIPDYILNKPGKLSEEEWEVMKTHAEIGYRIASATTELSHIAYKILCHHERYDGKGYPNQLKENEIPVLSRVLNIVDSFDVMTHDRPYKKAMPLKDAIEELERCSGTQFDPELVKVCILTFKNLDKSI